MDIPIIISLFSYQIKYMYILISDCWLLLKHDSHAEKESRIFTLKETVIHNAEDTAFVNTCFFFVYVIYEVIVCFRGAEMVISECMTAAGWISVVVGISVGLIPGYGPQIIFVSLFTKGIVLFAALLSNAISQDGDALFPLISHR